MKIDILGTKYNMKVIPASEDPMLESCDGYCDYTIREIVVAQPKIEVDTLKDIDAHIRRVKRHEIVHAFLYESGLGADWGHEKNGHDETFVDWIARQAPKLFEAFRQADAM